MKVLVIAAHPDDEVLGAGGTIASLAASGADVHVLIVTEGCTAQYPDRPELIEKKEEEARAASRILGAAAVHFGRLPDMRLDTLPIVKVNACIERLVQELKPERVFTQAEHDINLDHTIVFRATCVACRPYSAPWVRELSSYYTPSSSEWGSVLFVTNQFVDISAAIEKKLDAMRAYGTEVRRKPHPRNPESLRALAAAHGSAVGCEYAEIFHLVRRIERF